MNEEVDYHGVESIRLKSNHLIPNLYTIASLFMYESHVQCPLELEDNEPKKPRNVYDDIERLIEKSPFARKHIESERIPLNKIHVREQFMSFRNNNQQGSKLVFFDFKDGEWVKTYIGFHRVEAACYLSDSRLALLVVKNKTEKILVVERVLNELDVLQEYDVSLESHFHCVDIRAVRSEAGREYLVIFLGYETKPSVILVFECTTFLNFVTKKQITGAHGRLFPIVYEAKQHHSGQDATYFYIIGGKVKSMGSTKCYMDYDKIALESLFKDPSNPQLHANTNSLKGSLVSSLGNSLYNGVVSNGFILLPKESQVLRIVTSQEAMTLVGSNYRLLEDEDKHKRFLPNEICVREVDSQGSLNLELIHVCHHKQKYIQRDTLHQTHSYCLLS